MATVSEVGSRRRLAAALVRPVDARGLAPFRILLGLVLFASAARFLQSGWIPRRYGEPTFFFHYWGLGWIEPLPVPAMVALHAALAVLALGIALGIRTRLCAALFAVGFTYAELIDVTNYLNHYYLVSMLALLLVVHPLDGVWSVHARRRPGRARATVPAWVLYVLRIQVGLVYVYAGLAKLQPDWLLGAQPLNIWLTARADTPLVGWLSWRRTRRAAYAALLLFHTATGLLFHIGIFPFVMTVAATVFFSPSWPARLVGGAAPAVDSPHRPPPRLLAIALGCHVAFQVLFPLRHFLYPGDVLWNEQGMRFSWRVLVREKHGAVTYHVRFPATGKRLQVSPGDYLTVRQEREMAGQPDLILQLAHHIADDFARRGYGSVEVRVDALVSLNGRRPRRIIDPGVDLARVPDDLRPAWWITDAPEEPPRLLSPRAIGRSPSPSPVLLSGAHDHLPRVRGHQPR